MSKEIQVKVLSEAAKYISYVCMSQDIHVNVACPLQENCESLNVYQILGNNIFF